MAIDFELDDAQKELGTAARRLFEQAGGVSLARELMGDEIGYAPDVWRQMCDLGWVGMAMPDSHGGGGGGVLDLYALYLETGRALVATPHLAVNLCADVLGAAGSAEQQGTWLPRLAGGEAIMVPAWLESSGTWDDAGVDAKISNGALTGMKLRVPFANSASALLVTAWSGDELVAVIVDSQAAGVTLHRVDNLAGLPLYAVELAGVSVAPADVIGAASGAVGRAVQRGAVLRCAEIAGAGEPVLDLAVDYANQRVQFGKPIGSHQAVQYLCTDIAIEAHLAGLLSLRAAWLLDTGAAGADRAVAAAKLYASRTAHHIANRGHEVFAGLAFMMEHDLHLFTRHLKHWEHDVGGERHHSEALVGALVDQIA